MHAPRHAANLSGFAERWAATRERIDAAARRVGRDPTRVRLIGASKGVPAARLRQAVAAGLGDLGENRVQEARAKIEELRDLAPPPRWHLIGHLQSNKAKLAAALFDWVHSLDSIELAHELDRRAGEAGRRLIVLIQVNTSGEASKHGVESAAAAELLAAALECAHLEPRGFMTLGPWSEDRERTRAAFRALAETAAAARSAHPHARLDELSMGMSGDFEIAVEEGATCVRVGTALFGERRRD